MNTPNFADATWRKSSFSGENGTCVEVAHAEQVVGVRDSKKPAHGQLAVATAPWHAFVDAVKNDHLA